MPLLSGRNEQEVAQAAQHLADGELVGFPTETVYGLGARADDDAAVRRIFEAKGRPSEHPLIVHVADAAGAAQFAAALSPVAHRLMQAFWPGPLTVIVPRRPGVATAAAGGQHSIGLRSPAHPVAQALLKAASMRGVAGVAGPSANRFGRISPTTAAHVQDEFGDGLTVLDGGACDVGIESTIIDCTRARPVLLRPGVLRQAEIEAAVGEPLQAADAEAPRASGTLAAHYAPNAKLVLLSAEALRQALASGATQGLPKGLAVYSRTVPAAEAGHAAMHRQMPTEAALVAQQLFAVLREFDARAAHLIWVEQPPDGPEWDGVRDRLQRAAAA